ncbi:ABC-type metal ion transporter, periplasmic subunit [Crinalium epipsammum PCC 9333]|uniref:ABC-type metal ion transporter, periplasmic subunit n=1 Tax=Crinalium epipsammum PCC 9333 TaxID=1173022 RepID=K9VXN7_9CYAN|nr:zinc ABC transporter substrate-binding protein [Crinalium epipsammum]AFZ12272.1 ABC-type metal ion transporter, periplasmic subunit [Crinalium epipsammum PCC 9333]
MNHNVNKKFPFYAAVGISLLLVGCNPGTQSNNLSNSNANSTNKLPTVVATHSVLCDLAKLIAQNTINLTCLIQPGVDVHVYKPTPQDRKAIEKAQLILYGGYNFEPELIKIINASNQAATKVAVHEVAVPKPLMEEDNHHEESEKSAKHEIVPNPHIWHNAQNGIRMVEVIREQLTKLSPVNFNVYAANAHQLSDKLKQLDAWTKAQINTIPLKQRKLVTTHESLNYYANAYGLTIEGALQGLSTEEKPTALRVKELVTEIKNTGVPTIFTEATGNDKVIRTVAKEAKVKVAEQGLFVDSLGTPGSQGDTYIGMLTSNTCTITTGLGGKCSAFLGNTLNK